MSTPNRPKDGKPGPKAKAAPPRAGGGAKPPSAGAKSGPPARRAPTRAPSRSPRGPREDYPTAQAFIAIGANLGDAEAAVKAAMADIGALQRTVVTARSSLYRSEPVDA